MAKSNRYRQDSRTEEEFNKDIAESTKRERLLMELYVNKLNNGLGTSGPYTFVDNGVDNTGKPLENDKVTTAADFLLKCPGKKDRLIEIKHAKGHIEQIHIKLNHLNAAIKNDVCILVFNGAETDNPQFFILRPKDIEEALKTGYRTRFWKKDCIRFYRSKQKWYTV